MDISISTKSNIFNPSPLYCDLILEIILGYVANSESKKDRLNSMLVNKIWLKNSRIVFYPYTTLLFASIYGGVNLLREILENKRIDPSILHKKEFSRDKKACIDDNCRLFTVACWSGNVDVVKELLKDKRIDPSENENEGLIIVCHQGHVKVLRELLKDKRVDPSDQKNLAIKNACLQRRSNIVKELLKDKRIDPTDLYSYCAYFSDDYEDVLRVLVTDGRANPSDGLNCQVLIWACYYGHLDIVKMLLKDKRVDPTDGNNKAFEIAAKRCHCDIMNELLGCEKVAKIVSEKETICTFKMFMK